MKRSIQGSLTIRVTDDEMLAYIDYEPSQVLVEWSDELILGLLRKAGVTKGYKPFQFIRLYEKIRKLEEPQSYKIAEGRAPVSGGASKFNIIHHPMIDSLLPVYNRLCDQQSRPIVFEVDDEFKLGAEPGEMSFVTLNKFYVNKGDTVAIIDREGKPKNGYSVTGKELTPPEADDKLKFHLSNQFEIVDNKVISRRSGFVREGKNWLDLMLFRGHTLAVYPAEDFSEYYLSFAPGSEEAPEPTYNDILTEFNDIDFSLSLLKEEKDIIPHILNAIMEKKRIKFSITKRRNHKVEIVINQSKTRGTLELQKGAGPGSRLSLKEVGAKIRESQIKGMNLNSIKKRILDFYKSRELSLSYVILEGKIATRGEPRRLKYLKEFIGVDKIEGIVERITKEIEAFYPSFKEFSKDDISSAIKVQKGMDFALLTDPVPGDDGKDIYGNKIKGIPGNDPIIKTHENISVKQGKFIANIDGILDLGEINGETHLRVREHKDMFVDISVSRDSMNASFTFYKEQGSGESASFDFIMKQIEDAGIVKGIDETVVKESLEKYKNGELISEVVFAQGKVPTDRKSSRIRYYKQGDGAEFSYELTKGDKIAKIFPSKEQAEDGFDVLGTVMEASSVISLELKVGDFILEEKQEDGSVILIADSNGELKVTDDAVTIIDKKVLPSDVNNRTGSIKTLCSLVVKGGVESSFYVMSGGNIKILGTVQGALISADKNIIVSQGVKGSGKAVLRAKEKVDVKFIEQGNIMAVDDVHVRKAALQTKIISNGKVLFDKSGSKIIGGETYAKKGVSVDEIGSIAGNKTSISFGQDYLVADKIKVFEGDVEKIQEDLVKIDQFLHKPGGHINQDKITHLRKQKVFLMKKLEKKNMKLFLLREKFEEHAPSEIVVRKRVYPGVVFESHGRKLEIMNEEPGCKVVFNPNTGQIEKQ